MSRRLELHHWNDELASRLPGLSLAFVFLLALYSHGMILARNRGLSSVVLFLHDLLGWAEDALRQRLREFYKEAPAKAGVHRKDFEPSACFAPLPSWLLSLWPRERLALALDVTNLGERFHVLCVSALYGGVAIPVAWKVLPGGKKEPWHPHWCALLEALRPAVPEGWLVAVPSDRGLESPPPLRGHHGPGLAPPDARQGRGQVPPGRLGRLVSDGVPRAARGPPLRGQGGGVHGEPAGLHAAGLPGRGARGAVADPDGPAGQRGLAVLARLPLVDRAGVQGARERGAAMAQDADGRRGAGRAGAARAGRGDPVSGGHRGGGGVGRTRGDARGGASRGRPRGSRGGRTGCSPSAWRGG